LLTGADELLLATDEDREGEAIAWHLLEELKPKVPARRMVFHEITPQAIAEAVAHPRDLDRGLVDAYQTRRGLDRPYGCEVSPVLWKKGMPRLSAGGGGGGGAPPRLGRGGGGGGGPAPRGAGPGGGVHPPPRRAGA